MILLLSSPRGVMPTQPFRLSAQRPAKTLHTRPIQAQASKPGDLFVRSSGGQLQPIPIPVEGPVRRPVQARQVRIPQPVTDVKNPPETETSLELKDMGPLGQAVFKNQGEKVEELLAKLSEEEINQPDANGFTPLAVAVRYGNDSIVEKLLENPKVDRKKRNQDGRTPLTLAIRYGRSDILRQLLPGPDQTPKKAEELLAKLDLNVQDKDGYTALDWAIRQNNFSSANKLKALNAQSNVYEQKKS